jgi:heme exporter protein C
MENRDTAGRAVGILAVVGLINIPIIKWSVNWWNTLHQPASFSLTEKPAMPIEMWLPLLVSVIGFDLFFVTVLMIRMQGEILQRESRADWVRKRIIATVTQNNQPVAGN